MRNGRNTGKSSPPPAFSNRVPQAGTDVPERSTRRRRRAAEGLRAPRPPEIRRLLASRDAALPQTGGTPMTCRTIAVANQKGGTAKTATSADAAARACPARALSGRSSRAPAASRASRLASSAAARSHAASVSRESSSNESHTSLASATRNRRCSLPVAGSTNHAESTACALSFASMIPLMPA